MEKCVQHNSSFRDTDAVVVKHNNEIIRFIFESYKVNFDAFESSGLLTQLHNNNQLITHTEITKDKWPPNSFEKVYKVIQPSLVPFISYPYEWSFSQLKEAALLTINIQLEALEKNMSLKDATGFNVQFINGKPVFIDTTSFQMYKEGEPWEAYKQFCQHFLAPLFFYKYNNHHLIKLLWSNIDGIPLMAASKALPYKTKFIFFVWTHIHYHAKLEAKYSSGADFKGTKLKMSKDKLKAFLLFIKNGVEKIELPKSQTEWSDYYQTFSYSTNSFKQKQSLVDSFLKKINSKQVLDVGCNEGEFSVIASQNAENVVAVDFDYLVVEKLSRNLKKNGIENILPLILDISNPTPAIGWANTERQSFFERAKFDSVLALAVIHHICIGNNVPLDKVASLFASLCTNLIIEFVHKDDSQTQKLLITKKDVFYNYTIDNFKIEFQKYFKIVSSENIEESNRVLYLMTKHA